MRVKYCGSSCQKSHFKQHNSLLKSCVPFYFIAGKKRTSAEEKEDEDKAESDYVKLYAAYKRSGDETLVPQLENLFGRMSDEARVKYRDGLPCHEGVDPLSQDDISSLEPDNRFYLMTNNIKYCFNLDLLVGYVNSREAIDPVYGVQGAINPISRQPLSEEDIQRLSEAAELRKLTLWTKVRETQDITILRETLDTLLNMYREKEYIIQGAKSDRLKRELKKIGGDFSSLIRVWPLLHLLDLKRDQVDWKGIVISMNTNMEGIQMFFKNKKELYTETKNIEQSDMKYAIKFGSLVLLRHFYPQQEVGSNPFETLKKLLDEEFREYRMYINRTSYNIIIKDNETVRDAYNRTFLSYVTEHGEKNVNETWLLVSARWQNSNNDPETTKKYQLPWPGQPVFDASDVAILIVSIDYITPYLNFRYLFPTKFEDLQPKNNKNDRRGLILMEYLMGPLSEFKRYAGAWPITEKNDHFKLAFELILNSVNKGVYYMDDITQDPYEQVYNRLRDFIHDPSLGGNVSWDVSIWIKPDLDKVYKEGIKYLAANWKHYHKNVGVDYKDIDWDKIPYDPKEGKYWAQLFDGVEDMAYAYMTTKFFDFYHQWRMGPRNAPFWTAILGTSEFNQTILDIFYQQLSKAQHNYQQKEWAKTAKYVLKFPDTVWAGRDVKIRKSMDLYSSYQRALSHHLQMTVDLSYGVPTKHWMSMETWWSKLPNIIAKNKGTFQLPWPEQTPMLEKPNEEVVLNVRMKHNSPSVWIEPHVSEKLQALGFPTSFGQRSITHLLDKISKYQGNREFQDEVRNRSTPWWNGVYLWDQWPEGENRLDYQIRVVFKNGDRTGKITRLGELAFDNVSNSPYVSIIQYLSNLIEDGVLDDAYNVFIEITIEEKQK
jgi:hypothetical protein